MLELHSGQVFDSPDQVVVVVMVVAAVVMVAVAVAMLVAVAVVVMVCDRPSSTPAWPHKDWVQLVTIILICLLAVVSCPFLLSPRLLPT